MQFAKAIARVSTEEIDVLVNIYPNYALWLASGQIAPEIGQTSPDYDAVNEKIGRTQNGQQITAEVARRWFSRDREQCKQKETKTTTDQ